MVRDELRKASETLSEAADRTDDETLREGLAKQADQLASLADRDRGPDHGRLDRHQQSLRELKAAADDETADRIDTANEHIVAYRKTVEGV
ncbi:MAG: hypothetical protein SVG88_09970 [Halobacteriales archaeon]|nr:hypothetical protein [Halobacteriales archaeon]